MDDVEPQVTHAHEETRELGNGTPGYTPAAAYPGFRPPTPLTLPSGAVFLVQRPQLQKMIRRGMIPNPLMSVVDEVFNMRDERELAAEAEAKGIPVEQLRAERQQEKGEGEDGAPPIPEEPPDLSAREMFQFRDVIVWAAIVAPEVEIAPAIAGTPLTENGNLAYEAIDDADTAAILSWVNEETAEAERFRAEQGRPDGGGDSGTVRPEAVRPALDPA